MGARDERPLGRSKTSGIFTDEQGNKIVNKVYQGRRIFRRLGAVSQQEAEQWLARQTEERRKAREFGTRPERNFADAAEKYLIERAHKASIDADAFHITALLPFIGMRPLREIHDGTLEPFKAQRRRDGVSETTIKRALEVVRCILNLAARSWRDEHGTTWLETAPLITMPDTRRTARKPYPLSWDEQRSLFALLPATIAHMALFAVNTGCREQEVCQLRWAWEVPVPELETSVFVIPAHFGGRSERSGVKNREDRCGAQRCGEASGRGPKRTASAVRVRRQQRQTASADPLHEQHGLAESTQGGRTGGSGARSQTHVRTAFAYGRRVLGDAQSSAWPQDRGHHQSLQRPGTCRADPSGERDPEDAGINVVAGGSEAIPGGHWGEVAQKSRRAKNGPGA